MAKEKKFSSDDWKGIEAAAREAGLLGEKETIADMAGFEALVEKGSASAGSRFSFQSVVRKAGFQTGALDAGEFDEKTKASIELFRKSAKAHLE